jgi:hypothetical protein
VHFGGAAAGSSKNRRWWIWRSPTACGVQSAAALIKAEIFNLFNDQSLVAFNTTVTPKAGAGCDGAPARHAQRAFGTATAITSYPRSSQNFAAQNLFARTFLLSTGFRF